MKRTLLITVFCFLVLNGWAQTTGNSNWKLVWSEEFNYTGLPDSSKWIYEKGFVRNNEKQYYTTGRRKNAYVENGVLTITGRKEDFIVGKDSANYTSASITTQGKAVWQYGKIEARAKIPQGLGVWPAIWLLGENIDEVSWPKCGEVDIMEFVGHDSTHIYGTFHYADTVKGEHAQIGNKIEVDEPYKSFHMYAVEWDKEAIKFMFDGKVYHSVNLDVAGRGENNSFRKPFYLILNLALGGEWGGPINDSNFPKEFVVDYVRVYQAQ
jgi:beta-glucanase (GH16 family)